MPAIRSESIGVSTSAVPSRPSHPPALRVICAVEFFERFGGGITAALLALYLNERFGFTEGAASKASGYFQALGYAGCVGGGLLADRVLGYRASVALGCALLGSGFLALALGRPDLLWPALGGLAAGTALFKPGLSSLLGRAYVRTARRVGDGYAWLYFTANVSVFVAPPIAGVLRSAHGWGAVFVAAAVALGLALGALALGARQLSPAAGSATTEAGASVADALSPALRWRAGLALLAPLIAAHVAISQTTGPLMFWARDFTRRAVLGFTVPPDVFGAVPAGVVLAALPVITLLWRRLARRGLEPSDASKIGMGLVLCVLACAVMVFPASLAAGPVSAGWLLACKVMLTLGELLVLPLSMSLVSRFAPPRFVASSLGVLFVVHALGYWLGGVVGGLWARVPALEFFVLLTVGMTVSALVFALTARHITQALAAIEGVAHA